jgi:hypothetical protein
VTGLAAAALAFNLICTGTTTTGELMDFDKPKTPVTVVLRVDLEKNRWCSGDCKSTAAIKELRETSIIFRMGEDDNGDDFFYVNRETGELLDRTRSFALKWITLTQGQCEKAPFTGFPARKF